MHPPKAPEVMSGEPFSPAADVYSFGVLLWTLITGGDPATEHTRFVRCGGRCAAVLCAPLLSWCPGCAWFQGSMCCALHFSASLNTVTSLLSASHMDARSLSTAGLLALAANSRFAAQLLLRRSIAHICRAVRCSR